MGQRLRIRAALLPRRAAFVSSWMTNRLSRITNRYLFQRDVGRGRGMGRGLGVGLGLVGVGV